MHLIAAAIAEREPVIEHMPRLNRIEPGTGAIRSISGERRTRCATVDIRSANPPSRTSPVTSRA